MCEQSDGHRIVLGGALGVEPTDLVEQVSGGLALAQRCALRSARRSPTTTRLCKSCTSHLIDNYRLLLLLAARLCVGTFCKKTKRFGVTLSHISDPLPYSAGRLALLSGAKKSPM